METVLDVRRGSDVVLVRAAPSWITGQAYAVAGALGCRCTTVLGPWDELAPSTLSAVMAHARVTGFIASASVLKRALGRGERGREPGAAHLRVGVSCGEPLSATAHELAMESLASHYINAYWATEHGVMVLAPTYGNAEQPVRADARMRELPWVDAAVWVPDAPASQGGEGGGRASQRVAACDDAAGSLAGAPLREVGSSALLRPWGASAPGASFHTASQDGSETGVLVCRRPWPAMARTVWGRVDELGTAGWRGDHELYARAYWPEYLVDGERERAFSLGDLAQRWGDGSVSVIGRHHELMLSSGTDHERSPGRKAAAGAGRVCVCEVENTLLKQRAVLDCLVVVVPVGPEAGELPRTRSEGGRRGAGAPAEMAPVACLVLQEGCALNEELVAALKKLVHEAHGEHCVPTDLIPIGAIPRTHNSKPMRQVVGQLFAGNFGGDVAEISNPECLTELGATIADWRAMRASPVLDELP